MKPHVIVTSCDAKYGRFLIDHWLRSLRENVDLSQIDIAVLDYGLTREQAATLRGHGVIVHPCQRDGHITNIRHRDLAAFLRDTLYDQVASIDGGDIIFQTDISRLFARDTGAVRAAVEPRFTGALHQALLGTDDLRTDCRAEILKFMRDRPEVNGGVIVASRQKLIELSLAVTDLCKSLDHFATDQLVVSYLLYKGGFVVLPERYNFVLATTATPFDIRGGAFVDSAGEKIPIVHNSGQHDRFRVIRNFGYGPSRNRVKWVRYACQRAASGLLRFGLWLRGGGPAAWYRQWGRLYLHSSAAGWLAYYGFMIWFWLYVFPFRNRFARGGPPLHIRSPYARHPMLCRPGTSDPFMFRQIFAQREYACLDELNDASVILDLGANVGYSSVYFLSRYPNARLIAVEPDRENVAILRENLMPFGDRTVVKHAGVWSHACGLVLESDHRWYQECSRRVREVRPGEPADVPAVDIPTLLAELNAERVSILKTDIETSEKEVFARNYEDWIDRVDCLVVELHDAECRAVFDRTMAGRPFDRREYGELTVCRRTDRR